MKSHQRRPVVETLEELHAIAVREHGPRARSTGLIGRALAEARGDPCMAHASAAQVRVRRHGAGARRFSWA